MSRLPFFDESTLTAGQREVYDRIVAKRGSAPAPHKVWVLNPGMARHTDELGWYFQNHSSLPASLYELAILLLARQWKAEYAWQTHIPRALDAGLPEKLIQTLREGGKPEFANDNAPEAIVIDFVEHLHARREIDPALYDRAVALLGINGVIDLTGLIGYFTMITATLKVFEIEAPKK